ncbi:iron ABC transporter permease [Cellulomonas marina]|uniref:Iron complex transport system permease protein n=1 Tax=Cellulomonas marina TaxID=988821 RepID=A0A1I1AL89_9CELL|nr:iron ABC transporter permease [Cellulomonas marina]GIG30155.1 iron-hydroxamate transporter permease subunit [Cellulomonas marina]SFB38272.1 iron complex transport system permease protein [Cellulomonas marina]
MTAVAGTPAVAAPAGGAPAGGTTAPDRRAAGRPAAAVLVGVLLLVVVLGAVDLTLGTSSVGLGDLVRLVVGEGDERTAAVLVASRLPRVLAAVLVGLALGVAGAVLQSVARNPLASPDTLAVNAGAHLAVVLTAVVGASLPLLLRGSVAFVGGLAAAGLVLALSRAGAAGPTRLVLAGSATTLALASLTTVLLVLFAQETTGLFAWGSGSVVQSGTRTVLQVLPVVLVVGAGTVALASRLDLLALGDDAAASLGLAVGRTRVLAVVLAVVLSAAAVTVAGPVGFVGLAAPVLARLVARRVPGLSRHRLLLPFAGLVGAVVVLAADLLLRVLLPGTDAVAVPTGVVTTLLGAVVLVVVARRLRDEVARRSAGAGAGVRPRTARRALAVGGVLVAALVGAVVAALLLGDRLLLLGDVALWLDGTAGRTVSFVLDQRVPRVLAAVLAGAALALAGAVVQAVCRNALAEPSLLGVTGGAGVGAVVLIVLVPTAGPWVVPAAAAAGALVAFALVQALAARGGLGSDRVVLVGLGVQAATTALITVLVVVTNPWNTTMALTWLSGSTYGRSLAQCAPVAVALLVVLPVALARRRTLDLVALDDDTPRVLGVRLARERGMLLTLAALLTAAAVAAVGIVGFVGLVAPHLARRLVGAGHARVLPVATVLGALLVSVSDTIGRTVIAPGQVPVGLVTALVGAPYFVWLLWRTRRRAGV